MNRSILLIFAHPDDESFGPAGTTAKYRDLGIPTDLICATRGEVGSRVDVPEEVETAAARATSINLSYTPFLKGVRCGLGANMASPLQFPIFFIRNT
jgi:LmbE family N-acetylglucosaminyl deacetylase